MTPSPEQEQSLRLQREALVIQKNDANPIKIDGLIYPRGALRFLNRDFPTGTSTPAMRKAKKRERLNKTLARRVA